MKNWKQILHNKRQAIYLKQESKSKRPERLPPINYNDITLEGLYKCVSDWIVFSGGSFKRINRGIRFEYRNKLGYLELEMYPKRKRPVFKPKHSEDLGFLTATVYSMQAFFDLWYTSIEEKNKEFKSEFISESLLLTEPKYSLQSEDEQQGELIPSTI